jgi:hypothetical protein
MKKIAFVICIMSIPMILPAQEQYLFLNAQFHYDIQRAHPTITLEFLSFDKLGSNFFFADLNFDRYRKTGGLSDVYFEFMRYFRIFRWQGRDVNITIQYNDGTEPVKQVWLTGLNLGNLILGPFNVSTEFLLKREYHFGITWQYTLVWYADLWKNKLIFNGYLDYWSNDNTHPDWPSFDPEYAATRYSFQAEPQIGWMLTPRWKLGSELEISRGFLGSVTGKLATETSFRHDVWYFLPTIFIQYNF